MLKIFCVVVLAIIVLNSTTVFSQSETVFDAISQALVFGKTHNFVHLKKYIVAHPKSVQSLNDKGLTPLLYIAEDNSRALILEQQGTFNSTASATERNTTSARGRIAAILIDAGANIEAKDEYGATALHWASHNGHYDIAKLLIDAGADIEAEIKSGGNKKSRPLHFAVFLRKLNIADLLVHAGADLTAKGVDGLTPLHFAVLARSTDLIKLLLRAGADVKAKDNEGDTALDIAKARNYQELLPILSGSAK